MKIYFETTYSKVVPRHVLDAWDEYLGSLRNDGAHFITRDRLAADVIIHWGSYDEILCLSAAPQQLRPLSNEDIRQIVWNISDRPTGKMSGFYCSLDKSLFSPDRHRTVHYPFTFNPLIEEFSQEDAHYNFGFVGDWWPRVRESLYRTLKPSESRDNSVMRIILPERARRFADDDTRATKSPLPYHIDYAEFIRTTKFILCPRGIGGGSMRMFEAMKAGRVPVIISDRYVLPSDIDWSSCSIRICERKIGQIPELLQSQLDRWPTLARNARQVWEKNFSSGNFFGYLMKQLEQIMISLPRATPARQFRYGIAAVPYLAAERVKFEIERRSPRTTPDWA